MLANTTEHLSHKYQTYVTSKQQKCSCLRRKQQGLVLTGEGLLRSRRGGLRQTSRLAVGALCSCSAAPLRVGLATGNTGLELGGLWRHFLLLALHHPNPGTRTQVWSGRPCDPLAL